MNEIFVNAFVDEIQKIGGLGAALKRLKPFVVTHWPALAAAGLGGVAVYDATKVMGTPEVKVDELLGSKETRVSSRAHISKILKKNPIGKPIIPVTTGKEARKMIDDIEAEDPTTQKYSDEERIRAYQDVLSIIGKGQNAAMLPNEKNTKFYIIAPPKVNRVVLEHELGHARDFARKDFEEPGVLRHLTSLVWWPSYKKTMMEPEERAWAPVEFKTEEEKSLRDRALGTYEGGFHAARGILAGIGGLATAALGYGLRRGR